MKDFQVILSYKLSGTPALNSDRLRILHQELKEVGNVKIIQNGGPQSGGVVDAVIKFIFDHEIKDVLNFIIEIYGGDLLIRGNESVISKKLKVIFTSFKKIENTEPNWDYIELKFQFSNTLVKVYGWNQMFTSKMSLVFSCLADHYNNLNNPLVIVIPIILEEGETNEKFYYAYRGEEFELSAYNEFWGIIDQSGNKDIYSVSQKSFIHKSWD